MENRAERAPSMSRRMWRHVQSGPGILCVIEICISNVFIFYDVFFFMFFQLFNISFSFAWLSCSEWKYIFVSITTQGPQCYCVYSHDYEVCGFSPRYLFTVESRRFSCFLAQAPADIYRSWIKALALNEGERADGGNRKRCVPNVLAAYLLPMVSCIKHW